MARGVRKTSREKLKEQLEEVLQSAAQYRECLKTLELKAKTLEEELEKEDLKELSSLLKENHMSPEDVKQMIQDCTEMEQGA